MDPKDIAKLITEDISVNRGLAENSSEYGWVPSRPMSDQETPFRYLSKEQTGKFDTWEEFGQFVRESGIPAEVVGWEVNTENGEPIETNNLDSAEWLGLKGDGWELVESEDGSLLYKDDTTDGFQIAIDLPNAHEMIMNYLYSSAGKVESGMEALSQEADLEQEQGAEALAQAEEGYPDSEL
jgi:hypothetical protein